MSSYKIEVKVETDSDGSEISKTWNIYSLDGSLVKSGIVSEAEAKNWIKATEDKEFLFEVSKDIKADISHPKKINEALNPVVQPTGFIYWTLNL
ncbi:hypothetical protein KZD03_08610 [Escherichia coli]|uniref:hypothetical protein n=1 Tax=Escherichia coli TaxID=562 RepID=UPI001CD0B0CE|nr:hypothetical protein [Escherichia coli]MCA0140418.1 hypothetical protein [Escherichia coli]MCF7327097.1 hypothetical protein [Escherichia coli]